jgi:hypothetical protein
MGIPPAAQRPGFQTYTNMLYAYSLKRVADLLVGIGRPALAAEYQARASAVVKAFRAHCFNGHFFTDCLAMTANLDKDLNQHTQIWAVLCGAVTSSEAVEILSVSLSSLHFTPTSIAMSFYTPSSPLCGVRKPLQRAVPRFLGAPASATLTWPYNMGRRQRLTAFKLSCMGKCTDIRVSGRSRWDSTRCAWLGYHCVSASYQLVLGA